MARANPKSQSFTITCVDLYEGGSGVGKSKVTKLTITCVDLSRRGGDVGKSKVTKLHNYVV